MPRVVFYLSGHGLGHASRQVEIINALMATRPSCQVSIKSSAPAWLFSRTLRARDVQVVSEACDTGIVQRDSLHLDEAASIERAVAFHANIGQRAAAEAAWLRRVGASLVVADAPPLACLAAAGAGVPAFVVGNFTWDWIYAGYADQPGAAALADLLGRAYTTATAAWRLPMAGGFATIDRIVDVPFVARHARHTGAEVRRAFDLPDDRPLVLLSFGGYGLGTLAPASLELGPFVVVTLRGQEGEPSLPHRQTIRTLDEDELYARGFRYEDLVGAVDIVLTKPGYGIVSECIANRTAIAYTSRGRFIEYERLVEAMPRWVPVEFISHDDLFAGRWSHAFQRLLSRSMPQPRPRCDGAEVIVDLLLERLAEGT